MANGNLETQIGKEVEHSIKTYVALDRMSGGATSNVYRVVEGGSEYAVKASPFGLDNERKIVTILANPHILPILDAGKAKLDTSQVTGDKNNGSTVNTLKFPFIPHSLTTGVGELTSNDIEEILEQQRGVMEYIHSQGVVHKDIKEDNILLKGTHSYLSDFGNAEQFALPAKQEIFEQKRKVDIADFEKMRERLVGQHQV